MAKAQLSPVEHGAVALDEPRRLQLPHPGLAGRLGQADPPRKLGDSDAPVPGEDGRILRS
jgi:hypothetical protein